MKYLGIHSPKPRVAVFELTGCEGCNLQLANREETLGPFLEAIDIVQFREISDPMGDDYQIALVDGAVTRNDEVERVRRIRDQAEVVVALGSCACFGGVNRLKDHVPIAEANREVYGDHPKESWPARPLRQVIDVDLEIPGCPINKAEIERVVQHLVLELPFHFPAYPVCLECKQRYTVCQYDLGNLCLGPITRAGCNAPCPAGGLGCWGCRGPAADPNFEELFRLTAERGFSGEELNERLSFFGGFDDLGDRQEQRP